MITDFIIIFIPLVIYLDFYHFSTTCIFIFTIFSLTPTSIIFRESIIITLIFLINCNIYYQGKN
ncbi:hypothetical protein H8356DRAFT_1680701 [Neocallimastix lanati (nom. inval.)]|nr:hypothetical protein H8356DRAFT_1680701 [Neocallimastix sp. JGI-2020a]